MNVPEGVVLLFYLALGAVAVGLIVYSAGLFMR